MKIREAMNFLEIIKSLIYYERKSKYLVIIFYDGEQLVKKNMIKNTIDYINSKNRLLINMRKRDDFYGNKKC